MVSLIRMSGWPTVWTNLTTSIIKAENQLFRAAEVRE